MKTLSVQQQPNGFEIEVPSFSYWVKAGIAFTLGASTVGLFLVVLSWVLAGAALGALISLGHR